MISTYRYFRRKYDEKQQPQKEPNPTSTRPYLQVPEAERNSAERNDAADTVATKGPTERSQSEAEKRALRKYRLKVILGLILPYSLQALDVTM